MSTPLDDYKYAVQLYFDEHSEGLVTSYIQELRSQGLLNPKFISERYRPHISLAVFQELQQEYCEEVLQALAVQVAPFQLTFSHIGIFSAELKVLYLGPTFCSQLQNLHHALHSSYLIRPEDCWHYYLPDHWVPDCGLLIDEDAHNIAQAALLLMAEPLPVVRVASIVATGFPKRLSYRLEGEG